jgi:hypothetical protein
VAAMAEITYLMDRDPAGTNQFFTLAKKYFAPPKSEVVEAPAGGQTLEGVFDDLRKRATAQPAAIFTVINLITHATGFSSLEFGLTRADQGKLTLPHHLINALATAKGTAPVLRTLGPPAITDQTHIRLFGCDVGKDEAFLKNFGLMFGQPADIAAPLRVAAFRESGGTVVYRLARTWAVPWPSDISTTKDADWPATRTEFITRADTKFGLAAAQGSPDPAAGDIVKAAITKAAGTATAAMAKTFFFHEYLTIDIPPGEPDPQAFVNRGAPTSSTTVQATEFSDLTVKSTVNPADFTDRTNPNAWKAHLAILGEILDEPVGFDNKDQYRKISFGPAAAPSAGPKAVGDGGAPAPPPPPMHSLWEQGVDEFLAAGGSQDELDALVAGLDDTGAHGELAEPEIVALGSDDDPHVVPDELGEPA